MMHVPAEDIAPSFCCRIMSLPQSEFEHLEGIKHILSLKTALAESLPLRANRRGLVPLTSQAEKPTFTYAELLKNRRMGLSYKQIGKKLGIDPSKEEVMTVCSTLYDGLQGGVESIKAPTQIQPRTLLWFLFHRNPQNTLVEKLGEHAGYMLENYLTVADILHQQLSFCFSNPNSIASQHETTLCNN